MLLAARRLLNDDGEVWISCPNSQSWLRSGVWALVDQLARALSHHAFFSSYPAASAGGERVRARGNPADHSRPMGSFFDRCAAVCPPGEANPTTAESFLNLRTGARLPRSIVSAILLGQPARTWRLPGGNRRQVQLAIAGSSRQHRSSELWLPLRNGLPPPAFPPATWLWVVPSLRFRCSAKPRKLFEYATESLFPLQVTFRQTWCCREICIRSAARRPAVRTRHRQFSV